MSTATIGRIISVMIVGNGGVGKTSLAKKLITNLNQNSAKYVPQLGLEIYAPCELLHSSTQQYRISISDSTVSDSKLFGDYMHYVDYVIILGNQPDPHNPISMRKEKEHFEQWHAIAQQMAPNAKILALFNNKNADNRGLHCFRYCSHWNPNLAASSYICCKTWCPSLLPSFPIVVNIKHDEPSKLIRQIIEHL